MTDVKENSTLVQHKIHVEDNQIEFEHKYQWSSCCLRVDKRALIFFTQAAFSGCIVAFCITMLCTSPSCDTFSRYSPLLTLVVGIWLPSPQLKDSWKTNPARPRRFSVMTGAGAGSCTEFIAVIGTSGGVTFACSVNACLYIWLWLWNVFLQTVQVTLGSECFVLLCENQLL